MVAIKPQFAAGFLKSPDRKIEAFLFFGTDPGLVSERAHTLASTLAKSLVPEGEIMRLDDADLENDPGRLAVELRTIAMFGGRKIVRATTGRRINAQSLKSLVEEGGLEGVLIVEAGNLRPEDALRQMFEKPAYTAAIACYADEGRDLAGIVRQSMTAAGLTISPEAVDVLVSRLGADRILSRGEIEKLTLYALGKSHVDLDDVEAIVGDAGELAMDRAVLASASGNAQVASVEFARLVESGESPQSLLLAVQRHFHRLHRVRLAMDAGKPFDDAIRALRPPLFFKSKTEFARQARMWSAAQLAGALPVISEAAKSARLNSALQDEIAEQLLWSLAARAAPGRMSGHGA